MQINTSKNTRRWRIATDELPLLQHANKYCINQVWPNNLGIGHSNFYQLDVDLNYIESLYTPSRDLAILSNLEMQEPRLVVTLGLEGNSRYLSSKGEEVIFKAGYTTITSFNSGLGERHYRANDALIQLRFSIKKSWLEKNFGADTFSDFFNKNSLQIISHQPISPQGLFAAQQLLKCDVPEKSRRVYMHGLALSILAMELKHLVDDSSANNRSKFNQKDKEVAKLARDILFEEYKNPPSVEELARRVGTNQFKLKKLFYHFFNTTPYGVILELRMTKAYLILQTTHCHVSVAADQVGYNHASSFSAAFKKYFGVSPKSISKH